MNKIWAGLVLVVCVASLAGCPLAGTPTPSVVNQTPGDAVALTIGGGPYTNYLVNTQIQWYTFNVDPQYVGKPLDVVFRNSNQIPVGVELTVFSVSLDQDNKEIQNLEWQVNIDPVPYTNMTNENTVAVVKDAEKAMVVPGFVTPQAGKYYVCIEGYLIDGGYQPNNTYTYRDTLIYTIEVRFTPDPSVTDATALTPTAQAAAVPLITGYLEPGETVYHPVAMTQNVLYQIQVEHDNPITWGLVDVYSNLVFPVLGDFFMVGRDDTYYVGINNTDAGDFNYAEYRVRVYIDDFGYDNNSAHTFDAAADTLSGYLTVDDVDYFVMSIPANDTNTYLISTDTTKFNMDVTHVFSLLEVGTINWNGDEFECQNGSGTEPYTVLITIEAEDDFGLLDGIGPYTIDIAIQ